MREATKLHICCGDVYLKDYLNVDIKGKFVRNLKEVNLNETTLDNYYKFPFGTPRRDIVVDARWDISFWWGRFDGAVDEVVMISSIEHFVKSRAEFIISEVKRVLKVGGRFIVDFPDLKESVKQYYEQDPDFLMRLIYCNRKDEYSVHRWGYTAESFKRLLGEGWSSIENQQIVKHVYPMISIVATKG